jgi:hypothetical protein
MKFHPEGNMHRIKSFITLLPILIIAVSCNGSSVIIPDSQFAKLMARANYILSEPPEFAWDPQIAVDPVSGEVFVCWNKNVGGIQEIMWRHGKDGNFSTESVISDTDGNQSYNPTLTAGADGRVHFARMDRKDDNNQKEIWIKSYKDGAWEKDRILSLYDGWTGWDPVVETFPDGRPLVSWFDHRYGIQHEIIVRYEETPGGEYEPDVRMTNDTWYEFAADIDSGPGNVIHCTFEDSREQNWKPIDGDQRIPGKNLEVYYKSWSDGEFGPEVRITNSEFRSLAPQIAVDVNGRVHLIWADETDDGYFRLYYCWVENNIPSDTFQITPPDVQADLCAIETLGDRVFIAYDYYISTDAELTDSANIDLVEVLKNGELGQPITIARGGCNVHVRMASDPIRNDLWMIWNEFVPVGGELGENGSRIWATGVHVDM